MLPWPHGLEVFLRYFSSGNDWASIEQFAARLAWILAVEEMDAYWIRDDRSFDASNVLE